MKRIKIMPDGYDPVIAAGPPDDYAIKDGCHWTPEDTAQCKKMEEEAPIIEVEDDYKGPVGKWIQWVDTKHICEEGSTIGKCRHCGKIFNWED